MNDVNGPDQVSDISASGDTLEIPIRDEMIRLGQLLKLAGVVDDGAQARALIDEGQVSVDGEVERRRGRQVHPGSTVQLAGTRIRVIPT